MDTLTLEAVDDEIAGLVDAISNGFDDIPLPVDVEPYQAVPLSIALKNEHGGIEGGLTGHSVWDWLYVKYLWVTKARRGSGYGARLLDAAEHIARQRGCTGVWLHTLSFQAPSFYERQGYEKFGELPDLPKGHKRLFYRKMLTAG